MLRAVEYYVVECDFPGCEVNTGDLGEYSAYADSGGARDDWMVSDCSIVTGDNGTEFFYCKAHEPNGCKDCDESLVEYVVDGEFYCDECYHVLLDSEDTVLVSNAR
mgnify:CR=1 FL=1